jgi:hypothetical protein
VEVKYEELKRLKEKLEEKENEKSELENDLRAQKMDATDETTLLIQMNKMKKDKLELEKLEKEIEEMKKEIQNREQELKEIEETYGKKDSSIELS